MNNAVSMAPTRALFRRAEFLVAAQDGRGPEDAPDSADATVGNLYIPGAANWGALISFSVVVLSASPAYLYFGDITLGRQKYRA